jgi:hypothetical protein
MIAGALLVVAAAVFVATSLGGSSGKPRAHTTSTSLAPAGTSTHSSSHHAKASGHAGAANAAEINVAVLNGTETTGLAHRLAGELQKLGYSQAAPLSGRPPGSSQATLVQYASGHKSDAEGVARSLSVTNVAPMEAGVSSLAGSATVAVVVGADRAAGP